MDKGDTKKLEEESRTFWTWNEKIDEEIKAVMPENHSDQMKIDKLREMKAKLNVSENLGNYYDTAKYIYQLQWAIPVEKKLRN